MNKLFLRFLISLFFISSYLGSSVAQNGEDLEKRWSKIKSDPFKLKEVDNDYRWISLEGITKEYLFGTETITVEPNFRPKPTTNSTQSETSIDVHPLDNQIIFASANTTSWPVTTLYGTGVYWTSNGGTSWTGFDDPPFGSNSGDPVSVIGVNGNFYEGFITDPGGQGIAVSTNGGVSWSTYSVAPNPGSLADKNHLMVDKQSSSPFVNRVYSAWTDFGGSNDSEIILRYSTNFGQTWSSSINLSSTLNAGSHNQGVNIQTGPNGEVYASWAVYDNWPGGEDAIAFAKSTNGGVTWSAARVYGALTPNGNFNFGIRGTIKSTAIRVASFPSMTVDRSGGPNNGYIYITWPQRGVAPAGSDPDIVMIRSTDGGTTWSAPIRVNDDAMNNGKDQYYPWMTVDQATGHLHFVFYDNRETTNDSSGVYMARSVDGGLTFENYKVSDQNFRPKPISGLAGGYQGDYIGIAALNNRAYPYWCDDRTGNYQGWISIVTFGEPCPIEQPSNPNPLNGTEDVSVFIPQLNWINGSGANQCEVWFGEAGNMTKRYEGALISSWNIPTTLEYNTSYNWRVILKNDTCNITGTLWAFTTELSPGVLFIEPYNNLNNWSIIGPLGLTNWTLRTTTNAGGQSPEFRLQWDPTFDGLSKVVSNSIQLQPNRNHTLTLKHYFDWWANPTPYLGIGVSYDGGATYTPIWQFQATGNLGPEIITASFVSPSSDNLESIDMNLVLFCDGNSFNIDFWYIDDIMLVDDDYVASFPLTVAIEDGWNMVSVPGLHPVNQSVNTWWVDRNPAGNVFKFDGSYQAVINTVPGEGYWMLHSGNRVYNTGDEWPADGIFLVPNSPLTANAGWNMIGGYEHSSATSGITTTPSGLQVGSVFGYSSTAGYTIADNLVPGYAYWILLMAPGLINLPDNTFNNSTKPVSLINNDWGRITLTDNAGKRYTLYGVHQTGSSITGKEDLNNYLLPPKPPAGMFDVRYGSGRYAEDLNSAQTVELSGVEYPVTVSLENISLKVEDETGKIINTALKPGEEVVISNPSVGKLMLSGNVIPEEFLLEQNYPNPFNPSTIISWQSPVSSRQVLKVFDVLGSEVATLVDEYREAGRYEIKFDAASLTSGIYFYNIQAGSFRTTKKMILAK